MNPLRELQHQYAKILTSCYELYAEGKRCLFEDDPLKRFDCSNCEHREADHFCRSNFFLKKLVKLIAEHLAQKMATSRADGSDDPPVEQTEDEDKIPPAPFTPEQIEDFKAKGVSYEIETPLCHEHIWLVPERTDKDRIEFTPEEMNFLIQTTNAVEGKFIQVGKNSDNRCKGDEGKG